MQKTMEYNIQNTGRQGQEDLSDVGPEKGDYDFKNPAFVFYLSRKDLVRVVDSEGKKINVDYTKTNQPVRINAPKFFCISSGNLHDFCVPVTLPDGTRRLWNLQTQTWCNCFG